MPKKTLYWLCQIIGWGLYNALLIVMIMIFGGAEALNQDVIVLQLIIFTTLLLFSHLYRRFIRLKNWGELSISQVIPKAVLGALISSISAQVFIHLIIYLFVPLSNITEFSWVSFLGYVFNVFIVMSLWTAIYLGVLFNRKSRKDEIEKLELRAALQEAELAILKNQVNPHFLFNALNNIRSLILSDAEKARKMITHISELLRYSIQFNASEKVSLSQELEIVKDYLQLESVQFNDRLSYEFDISEETLQVKIPPMAIQLLVENAIKHGISQLSTGGNIGITATMEADHLKIEVTNTGQLHKKGKREGIGLKNLIERLQILFGQFADLQLKNSSSNTVTASLKIPLS